MDRSDRDTSQQESPRCPFGFDRLGTDLQSGGITHPFRVSLSDLRRAVLRMVGWSRAGATPEVRPGFAPIPVLNENKAALAVELLGNPVATFNRLLEKYGDIFQYRLPSGQLLMATSNPHVLRAVLLATDRGSGRSDLSDKSEVISDGLQHLAGESNLVASSNEGWRAQRLVLNRNFGRTLFENPDKIAVIRSVIDRHVGKLREQIDTSGRDFIRVNLQTELSKVALRVAFSLMFGRTDTSDGKLEQLHNATRSLLAGMPLEAVTPFKIPYSVLGVFSPQYAEMQRSDECISSFAEELLRAEEEKPSDPPNVLTSMVEALRTKTPLMTREVALNNIRLLIVASHETSGNVLAYALASLALRPELAEPVAREALQDTWLQASSLTELKNSLPRAREALEESLRMHPAFYATARRTTSDLEVETPQGKYFIPKDTDIALNLFAAQRDEAHWGEHKTGYSANEFAPQRWTAENATQRGLSDDDKDLFAFGMGSRVCIGAHMFWAEALPLIAQFMREFEMLPQFKDTDSDMNGDLSLQSGQGYPVLLKIRKRG